MQFTDWFEEMVEEKRTRGENNKMEIHRGKVIREDIE